MHPIDILKSDHMKISDLFERLLDSPLASERDEIFEHLRQELDDHMRAEETLVYPLLTDVAGFEDTIEMAIDDHQEMKDLLADIQNSHEGEETEDLIDELFECFEDHISEEESVIYPRTIEVLSLAEMHDLDMKLTDFRGEISQAA